MESSDIQYRARIRNSSRASNTHSYVARPQASTVPFMFGPLRQHRIPTHVLERFVVLSPHSGINKVREGVVTDKLTGRA